jgi:hypothetical protein
MRIARIPAHLHEKILQQAMEMMDDNTFARYEELCETREPELPLGYSNPQYADEIRIAIMAMPRKLKESFWRIVDLWVPPASCDQHEAQRSASPYLNSRRAKVKPFLYMLHGQPPEPLA